MMLEAVRGPALRQSQPPQPQLDPVWLPTAISVGLVAAGLGAITLMLVVFERYFASVSSASWPYLLVVLPVALRWGRVAGLATALVSAVLLISLPIEPAWSWSSSQVPHFAHLGVSLTGMMLAVLLIDRANRGRIATERWRAMLMERERLYDVEREARLEAEAALHTRDQFLSAISHDLQTPLTVIKGNAQLLERAVVNGSPLDAEAASGMLRGIDSASMRMVAMIGDLLDLARLQTGASPTLDRRPVDLVTLALQVVASIQQEPGSQRITVETHEPSLVGLWDQRRLERVVANLLSNAVKYSPDGGAVHVLVSREADPETGQDWAVLCVRDQGLGIPSDELQQIFEPFFRASNVADRIQGTGIGLSGSLQAVEQHGGRLTAESREGQGSTFTVCLPLG